MNLLVRATIILSKLLGRKYSHFTLIKWKKAELRGMICFTKTVVPKLFYINNKKNYWKCYCAHHRALSVHREAGSRRPCVQYVRRTQAPHKKGCQIKGGAKEVWRSPTKTQKCDAPCKAIPFKVDNNNLQTLQQSVKFEKQPLYQKLIKLTKVCLSRCTKLRKRDRDTLICLFSISLFLFSFTLQNQHKAVSRLYNRTAKTASLSFLVSQMFILYNVQISNIKKTCQITWK